jgi:glycerol-3-phosphate dehydrogenase
MADTPLTVVGAGVQGLAVAARLAPRFRELVILERRERHGSETSSRTSEVVHGGMYYPEGSLKARLCVRGKELLYELCERAVSPTGGPASCSSPCERRRSPSSSACSRAGRTTASRSRSSELKGAAGSSPKCRPSSASCLRRPAS